MQPTHDAAMVLVALLSVAATATCGGGTGSKATEAHDAMAQTHDAGSGDAHIEGAPDTSPGSAMTPGPAPARDGGGAETASACSVCLDRGEPQLLARVQSPALNAISGMAASWRNPGVLYVHNDRNALQFVALDEQGATVGQFELEGPGATGRDLEDMAVAPCPAGTCVYLADIGNNIAPLRSELVIFRTAEPAIGRAAPSAIPVTLAFERFTFSYPDGGRHNAESLLVDPSTGTIYVIDKRAAGQPSAVYKLPALDASRTTVAAKVADLPVPMPADQPATGAAAHPCGGGFLLRTNNSLYEFRIAAGAPFEASFQVTPIRVPVAMEAQGEAVTYAPDGRAYYTSGEQPSGAMAPINLVRCR